MVRKKGKATSKRNINHGDGSNAGCGGGCSDASARASSASQVVGFVGSGGENSASKSAVAAPRDDQTSSEKLLMDGFYEKLVRLHQSSGLSVVFNFREAMLDLYLLYREVTERGGFHQVSKEGKWNEVASILNLKLQVSLMPGQTQKVYESLLLQYEQMHYYRTPAKVYTTPGPGTPEQKSNINIHLKIKDVVNDLQTPPKPRTAYQLFVKMECDRLRKINREGSGNKNYRNMATEAWKHLSPGDRLPYIEASRKDKDRFNREMVIYEQISNQRIANRQNLSSTSTPSVINFGSTSPIDDGYYVTLEADAGNFFVPDESLVESATQMLKNSRPNDPIFQINWDGCCGSQD